MKADHIQREEGFAVHSLAETVGQGGHGFNSAGEPLRRLPYTITGPAGAWLAE